MQGRIADWKDDRGFGFIQPEGDGERVFFHITGMVHGAARPAIGDLVSYKVTVTPDGKTRAVQVCPQGLAAIGRQVASKRVALSAAALAFFPLLWVLADHGVVPFILFWAFAVISSITFVLYGRDKWAAKVGDWRTPERILHLCALFCGWPGALFAQQVFRHKSSKPSFQITFWFIVALNCFTIYLLCSPETAALIKQLAKARR